MATKRMFSQRIIDSARFIRMPLTTQALYFHLGMRADDDGVVEAYSVLRMTGCTEDDLRVLVAKGFVQILNADLVSYITDWRENNFIRPDRKVDSLYKDLLLQMNPSLQLVEKKDRSDVMGLVDSPWTADGQSMDGIDKNSIDKNSIGKDSNNTPTRKKYGQYKNVPLSDEQYSKLKEEFPSNYEEWIEKVSDYVETSGKHYKNYLAVIRNWAKRDAKKVDNRSTPKKNSFNSHEQREYNYSELDKLFDI